MWKQIKQTIKKSKQDKPGERFLNAHKRWNGRSGYVTILFPIVGALLIVAGILLGLIPGVPGVVLMVIGAGLIAIRFRSVAVRLDRWDVKARAIAHSVRRRFAHR